MNESRNPFRYSEPVPAEELLDRDDEAQALVERATGGNNSRLVAPRRYGKTSLLARVAQDARREGWAAVYVGLGRPEVSEGVFGSRKRVTEWFRKHSPTKR